MGATQSTPATTEEHDENNGRSTELTPATMEEHYGTNYGTFEPTPQPSSHDSASFEQLRLSMYASYDQFTSIIGSTFASEHKKRIARLDGEILALETSVATFLSCEHQAVQVHLAVQNVLALMGPWTVAWMKGQVLRLACALRVSALHDKRVEVEAELQQAKAKKKQVEAAVEANERAGWSEASTQQAGDPEDSPDGAGEA